MGRRNNRILPVIVTLEGPGVEIIEGKKRTMVPAVGSDGPQKVRWLIRAVKPVKVEIKALTRNAWGGSNIHRPGRCKMKRTALGSLLLIALILAPVAAQTAKSNLSLRFDRYYPLAELNEALQALQKAYPALMTIEEAGKSEEGRPIFAATLNNPKTGPALSKPGIYVDGNIHGNEIQGGEICLYLIDYLLQNYGKNKDVTDLLDKKCFYVVPVVNVDGRYHFFVDPERLEQQPERPHPDRRRPGRVGR